MQNTAEVGAAKVLRQHPLRVRDPEQALLFFVPVYTYVSKSLAPGCGNTSHRERMAAAAAELRASPQWQRFRGRNHFFVSTVWSTARSSYRTHMHELASLMECGAAGRYKQFCTHACSRRSSSLAACTIHAPYAINLHAVHRYRPRARRPLLVSFSGSLDVCCSGASIRCRLGDYILAAMNSTDVIIRPSLPANTSARAGVCTEKALKNLGAALVALHNAAANGTNTLPPDTVRGLALAHLAQRSRIGHAALSNARRLAEAWREAAVGEEAVVLDARLMSASVFCLTPAGDTCVQGRFYSAVAAGCIPVTVCKGGPHPIAFDHLLHFEPFWISVSVHEWDRPAALLDRLRRMQPAEVRRYQAALDRHRADILYDVPKSRVGSNMLNEMLRTCYSKEALADLEAHKVCTDDDGGNTWKAWNEHWGSIHLRNGSAYSEDARSV